MIELAVPNLRLDAQPLDYILVGIFFAFVIGVGIVSRRRVSSSEDFLMAGRSLPGWVTGLAFIAANLGATEILGMAANGSEYGIPTVHYYWIGAVPAMVFLGLIMMPFYYGSRVRSVPEFLLRRFGRAAHLWQSLSFAVATVLTSGISLFALALMINIILGWPIAISIVVAAAVVVSYTLLGGLGAAIYNEVLQFFVILVGLIPLLVVGLVRAGGLGNVLNQASYSMGFNAAHAWGGTGLHNTTNPFGNWIGISLGLGFVLSFGYWTTNFTEVQRALSAKDLKAARMTPIIASWVKVFLPFLTVIPGVIAGAYFTSAFNDGLPYNDTVPLLMNQFLPTGILGVALAGLLASFMAGMAAGVSAFNTVFTYDIWQSYIRPNQSDQHYLRVGRVVTVVGTLGAVGAAFIAANFNNMMNFAQTLAGFFNAPLFATFIVGMFWKRMTAWAGFWGLVAGFLSVATVTLLGSLGILHFANPQDQAFVGAGAAFVGDVIVSVIVSMFTPPKPVADLQGLCWGVGTRDVSEVDGGRWYTSPIWLGAIGVLVVCFILYVIFR